MRQQQGFDGRGVEGRARVRGLQPLDAPAQPLPALPNQRFAGDQHLCSQLVGLI
jgi:hypothetical protein